MKKNRRLLTLFIAFQLLYACVLAQKFSVGGRIGINMSAPIPTKLDSGSTGKPLIAPMVGLYGAYHFSEKWGVQTDIYYTQKGATYSQYVADILFLN